MHVENGSTSDTEQRRPHLAVGSVIAAGSSTNLLNIGAEHTVLVTVSWMLKLAIGFRKKLPRIISGMYRLL